MGLKALLRSLATDFIAVNNSSLSAGTEPANLESNDKNDSHHTTENDIYLPIGVCIKSTQHYKP
jgi:hypothetical protein